jgi:hypothetical protein
LKDLQDALSADSDLDFSLVVGIGFPATDPDGKFIYSGNPLTVHYHGGLVVGVSIPIYFSSVFK